MKRQDASALASACEKCAASIQTAERRERSEKPPALYDLTTLQREANRALGYTAQQTLDYLQALYEKKLCTYPRTDSRFLTDDMENTVPALVSAAAVVCGLDAPGEVLTSQVCNSGKVTDHHAVVPTRSAAAADLSALPLGEREVLRLVSLALLRAVCPPYRYAETAVVVECAGHSFSAKGKVLLDAGWRAYAELPQDAALPDRLTEGLELPVEAVRVKTGKAVPLLKPQNPNIGYGGSQFTSGFPKRMPGALTSLRA